MHIITQSKSGPFRPYQTKVLVADSADPAPARAEDLLHLETTLRGAPKDSGLVLAALNAGSVGTETGGDPTVVDGKDLYKAVTAVAGKNIGGLGLASGSWKLSSIAATTTEQEMVETLIANNVAPAKAPDVARNALQLLNNPLVRTVLVAISAGALTYVVVEKTSWSTAAKWWTIVLVGAAAAGLFWLLRDLGVAA